MSVGVNVMLQAIQLVAKALGDDYDVEVIEAHHNQKADSPSGTALRIAEVLVEALNRNLANVGVYGRHGMVGARPEKKLGSMLSAAVIFPAITPCSMPAPENGLKSRIGRTHERHSPKAPSAPHGGS